MTPKPTTVLIRGGCPFHARDTQPLTRGANYLGQARRGAHGSWHRVDLYTGKEGQQVLERRQCSGPDDLSEPAHDAYADDPGNILYDSNCPCCYLGMSHTVAYHHQAIAAHRKALADYESRQRNQAAAA